MIVKSATKNYSVDLYDNFCVFHTLNATENAFWIVDRNVYNIYKDIIFRNISLKDVLLIDAYENNKTIETALFICEKMTELSAKRNITLISVGGGITQDITGFVANVLYRGIKWIFVPTTLLAACDSCIGGKTSLNYKKFKNLLGTFFPPDKILIFPEFFISLSEKDYLSGLGEVVKFNIMAGKDDIDTIKSDMSMLLIRDKEVLINYVRKSLEFKKAYIEIDEFDRGERIKLNYAHTFGHAFETISNYDIPHGTAVALGMIVANRISYSRGWLRSELVEKMESVLLRIIKVDLDAISNDEDKLLSAIRKDKKQIGDSITSVLMHDDMSLEVVHDVTIKEVVDAIGYLRGLF